LGKYLVEKGRLEESIVASNRSALESKDKQGNKQLTFTHEALLNVIVANIKLKRFDEAKRLIVSGLKTQMNPLNRSKLLTNYGNIFYQEGKFAEAEKIYLEAIEIYPAALPPRINLGAIYAATNRFEDAERMMNEALAIDPNNATLLSNLQQYRQIKESFK
jgi:tetratricopeptide (TPR) repeat protein